MSGTNTEKSLRIHALVHAIMRFFEANRARATGIDQVLEKMRAMDLSLGATVDVLPCDTRHAPVLTEAVEDITAPDLHDIASCLKDARHDLVWREDNAQFYAPDADLGDGYRNCNLHSLLIGPNACGFEAQDFCLGFFLLGPRTLYRDHAHDAPELYVNLSPRSGWRLSSKGWQDYEAGTIIWNGPGEPHATCAYDRPFLSVFVWLENIDSICRVVPFPDWVEIEDRLCRSEF
ncbi:dimethylsulfonioproprionate lyase family protein [Alisedimentitalea sp. MJ-SS2]|uniref:dimethylsulfonioproprionate lyase family protein n=1 Tax=Aliisedimentitalea sp. MJ-SS2 TaxID=3049795 RepID=UPI002910CE7D|nr:dimethylsulfonioproprionate lyase family protein [Alisedimentitalea sp. MJ-SS2]MDU8927009.1 dimethylsulfonioproprionate lyase family protein [Alisedimentitalea sp. MJ-SS2]